MEIESASTFIASLIRLENRQIKYSRIEVFRRTLGDLLRHHYQHHWFPEKPCKGSGYRCLRINHKMDPIIAKAGDVCGFDEAELRRLLPDELTMWIDPLEVSYRIGENGSICVLYDGSKVQQQQDSKLYNDYHSHQLHQNNNNTNSSTTNHHHHNSSHHHHQAVSDNRYPGCKESVRNVQRWDTFNSNPRNHNMEPFAAYVSS